MGQTPEVRGLPDAAGGRSDRRLALRSVVGRFLRDERGTTAVEYGLICALIFVVVVGSIQLFATKATLTFTKIGDAVSGVM